MYSYKTYKSIGKLSKSKQALALLQTQMCNLSVVQKEHHARNLLLPVVLTDQSRQRDRSINQSISQSINQDRFNIAVSRDVKPKTLPGN